MKGMTPWRAGAGKEMPTGPSPMVGAKLSTISCSTETTFSGDDFSGVGIRSLGSAKSPTLRSTGAPFIPEPPTSIPSTFLMVDKRNGRWLVQGRPGRQFPSTRGTGATHLTDNERPGVRSVEIGVGDRYRA